MIYGPGIPVLFPIGLVALTILYFVERFSMAYYYRMPPNFDDELNYFMLDQMLWFPVLYAGIGFWMFTNMQIFGNFVSPIDYVGDHISAGHEIGESLISFDKPGWPFLILGGITICSRFMDYFGIEKYLYSEGIHEILKHKNKSESFYTIISKSDKLWLLQEEKFLK